MSEKNYIDVKHLSDEANGKLNRDVRKSRFGNPKLRKQAIANANNFADANKSDPFAFSRAMAHMRNGQADIEDYSAEPYNVEKRDALGRPFTGVAHKNVTRP